MSLAWFSNAVAVFVGNSERAGAGAGSVKSSLFAQKVDGDGGDDKLTLFTVLLLQLLLLLLLLFIAERSPLASRAFTLTAALSIITWSSPLVSHLSATSFASSLLSL
jgi:hypothetical protein